ncbi:MAG: sodium-dependent transporter [Candidatus Adiutrix sp.]
MKQQKEGQQLFGSFLGFLLVTIGFAVGVGSLWRFPYVCGVNGGAIFILAYVIIILLVGIPLLTAELSMGFAVKKDPERVYKTLAPGTPWYLASYLHLAGALFIVAYTSPIYAYILNYMVNTANGFFIGLSPAQLQDYFGNFTVNYYTVVIFAAINWTINISIVSLGLEKGLERLCKVFLPLLAVIMVGIIVYGLTLPNAGAGLTFLLKPDFSKFTFNSLLTVLGQAFFAIGIGMLVAMVFGGYIKNFKENILKSSCYICAAIVVAGVAAGFMIFPMVFAYGLEPAAGFGLTFITLPNVFNQLPGGQFVGAVFYLGFYIAALTSSAGVLEALVGALKQRFDISRKKALIITSIPMVAIGLIAIFSFSAFVWLDALTANYIIVIGAFVIAIFVGWVWGIDNFIAASNVKSAFSKMWLKFCVKYVSPIAILIIFIGQFLS